MHEKLRYDIVLHWRYVESIPRHKKVGIHCAFAVIHQCIINNEYLFHIWNSFESGRTLGLFSECCMLHACFTTTIMLAWASNWVEDIYLSFLSPVARWHWTYNHIHILLTSMEKVDNGIPVRSQCWCKINCREYGVLITTSNILTSPYLSISREVWVKSIMFIGTWLGVSFTIFHVEGEGKNIGV